LPPDTREQLQSTLGSAYSLERELGGGGMSRVFVADELALGRKVVVKVIAPELLEGLSAERFAREVKLAARLQQANIVPVLSAGAAEGMPYYTMPFVDGLSLRARLSEGSLPVVEAVSILRDVARALAYAHGQGVVHRDIKPENILLSGGAAVVTDFGIAKALSASRTLDTTTAVGLTRAGTSLGTPAYMAPEQAVGDPSTDHRADLYAWAVVAWELLAGTHPFAGRTSAHALIAAHVSDAPPPIGTRRPDAPPALAALIMRCLEKSPDLRPQSATEVLAALDAIGTPSGATDPATKSASRRMLAIAAFSVITVIVVVATIAYVARRVGNEPVVSAAPAAADARGTSLAVLPFATVGGDTANTYFAEGIADELTTALARLPGLRLAGRSSAARFKQRAASAEEIGTALGVGAVLDGTVRRAGDRIRVSAELTSTEDGRVLWKDSYEREIKDVFAVQDDITRSIVGALQVRLAGNQASTNASARGTSNLEAYDLYLRAMRLYRGRGDGLIDAERHLARALALDPNFARAHAMHAMVLSVTPYYRDVPVGVAIPRARAAAERAVELDPSLAEAYTAMGFVHSEAFEWKSAEAALRRAAELGPGNAEIAFRLGFMFSTSGRVHESIAEFQRAEALDPFYGMAAAYAGWALSLAGRAPEAVIEARRSLELDPANEAVSTIFANVLLMSGYRDEAVGHVRRRLAAVRQVRRLGFYGMVLGSAGAEDEARAILRDVLVLPEGAPGRASALSRIYLSLGDTSRALDAMESAAAGDGDLLLAQMVSEPRFDVLRRSARFAAVMRRFNLDVARVTALDGGRSR
jgi:eukaryotic-like serine/threonine-protein kinase